MCRLAAYLGCAAPLSTLLYDPPRSLEVLAYDPREQRTGNVNVDGTGIAWWAEGEPQPLRYVTDRPPWSDPNLPSLAPRLTAGAQLAAVRGATPGIGYGPGCVAPFVHGTLAGAHNGYIRDFRTRVARPLLDLLPDRLHARLDGFSDSQALFLLAAARHDDAPRDGLAAAVAQAVHEAGKVCAKAGTPATLTLVLVDGRRIAAACAAVGTPANSLYTLRGGARWPRAVLVASEPLDDDPAWTPVPPGQLVELAPDAVRTHPLDLESL